MLLENDLAEAISLDGTWQFSLGENLSWGDIQVPGCWEAQGYSKFVDGPARYRRELTIPASWDGKAIYAEFEAVSYACTILLNGVEVGSHRGLWTPFTVDLTAAVQVGAKNLLELIVYKPGERYPMRSSLAGFIPDVSTSFGGIWQSARVFALEAGIEDLWVEGDLDTESLRLHCKARKMSGSFRQADWIIEVFLGEDLVVTPCLEATADGILDIRFLVPEAKRWDPSHPLLYTIRVNLFEAGKLVLRAVKRTGFRKLSAESSQLLLNGQPYILRGILSWGWEPDQIAPNYSPEHVRAEIQRVRALGFNLIKLCLFVPNPVYFAIADEEGMLLWLEFPMWLPEVTQDLRELAPGEYAEITQMLRHHPSLVLYSLGCELSQAVDGELLGALNQAVRNNVSNVLVCDNSGSGESYGGLDFDFSDFTDYHPYYDLHYFEPLLDQWRRDWQNPRPWIFGEFCDSDTFRDLGEVIKANGGTRPWWLTEDNPVTRWRPESRAVLEAEQRLAQAQTGFSAPELVRISYAQSLVVRKYTLELLRRREAIGGYIVTGLRDTPISTSGVWDDFNRPKWSAEQFLPINGEAVLSLDGGRRRRWQYGGDRPDRLDLFNYWSGGTGYWVVILSLFASEWPLEAGLSWDLSDDAGKMLASGGNLLADGQIGKPFQAGIIRCQLPVVERAVELRLHVSLTGKNFEVDNQWRVWVYPVLPEPPDSLGILDPTGRFDTWGNWLNQIHRLQAGDRLDEFGVILSTIWDKRLAEYVQNGGSVLLLQQGNAPLPARRCPFWREAIKLFSPHPVWKKGDFPQHGYTDLQFFGLASDVAFETQRLSQAFPEGTIFNPILRRLDGREFHMSEYIFEALIGRGRLLACSLSLQGGTGAQPSGWERNVPGAALLSSFLNYLAERGL